jgi:hypothetical protein
VSRNGHGRAPPPPPPESSDRDGPAPVAAEPVAPPAPDRLAHLADNRRLILRRSLLGTALGGFIPVPLMDDYLAGRVRAGLLMRLGQTRGVDVPAGAAEVLAEPREGSTLRNATITAVTLVALKLAWKKFFFLLAAGRGAEEMAGAFQYATLFDHYCARLHVGGALTRDQAGVLRHILFESVQATERSALVGVFRDGLKVLGRSLLEAPRWLSDRLTRIAQRFVASGGNPDVEVDVGAGAAGTGDEARWLDRAAGTIEGRLAALGHDYLGALVDGFERRWRAAQEAATPPPGGETPRTSTGD